jgi:hypothetical protein
MKKNDMLNESTIRRFMKLATIDGLSDKFVAENLDETTEEVEEGRMRAKRDEDEMREGDEELEEMRGDKDKEEMDEAAEETVEEATEETVEEAEETVEEEVALEEEEMEMDMEMGAEEPAAGGMVSVDQLMSALEKALEDVLGQEVEVSQDGEDEMEMDLDAEEPADLDMDNVVEEVFARVIQRLTQETKSK